MSFTPVGCFSWLCGGKSSNKSDPKPAKYSEKDEASQVVPTAEKYGFEASKQTIEILQSFGDALPIPCANQVLEVALFLMTTHKEVTVIEQQAKDLNNQIGRLMLLMVDGLRGKDASSISPEVCRDIEKLGSDLQTLQKELARIAAQGRWLSIFVKSANKSAINGCIDRLNDALQTFSVTRTIEDGNVLFEIQTRLQKMDKTAETMANQVNQIYSWLIEKDAHNAHGPVLEAMPILPKLHGRDGVIKRVADILITNPKPRVGILGAGGMGKTSVAVAIMQSEVVRRKYHTGYRFWVPCVGVTSPTTFLQILSKSLRVTRDTGDPLKDLLYTLKLTQEPRLILLDNLETAMCLSEVVTNGGHLSVEEIINQLASIPHVAILVTIRSNMLPSNTIAWDLFPLEGVTQEDARAIFTSISPDAEGHPTLDALLKSLGYMPYAVTLMATQSATSGVDLDTLLEEWQKSGPNSLNSDLRLRMNRSIELSVKSRAMQDPDAQRLLAILGKLPSGANQKHLKWWASSVKNLSSAIVALNKTALITQRGEGTSLTLFVLPVVQSYLNADSIYNSPINRRLVLDACCKFVLEHKSSPSDQNFRAHLEALAVEQTNIQAILLSVSAETFSKLDLESAPIFEAMLAFSWYQYRTKYSPELLNHMLEISRSFKDDSTLRYIAEAHYCLGRMYVKLGRYNEACRKLENAHDQFSRLGTAPDQARAGESTLGIVEAWSFLDTPNQQMLNPIQNAQYELKGDPKGAARALMYLGYYYYWYKRRPADGLQRLTAARDTLENLGCTADVAECTFFISRCYGSMSAAPEALEAIQGAIKLSRSMGINSILLLSLIACPRYHIQLKQYDEALIVLKEALSVSEQLGQPLAVAQVFELIGYAYAMKRDFIGARIAYERAKKHYSNMEETPQTEKWGGFCEYNLRSIEQAGVVEGDVEFKPPKLY